MQPPFLCLTLIVSCRMKPYTSCCHSPALHVTYIPKIVLTHMAFSDGCPSGNQTLFTNSHVLAVVVPPVDLHTAPMGMKLGSYPGLGTDGLWCKGLALSPRQSARRSPQFRMVAPVATRHFSRIQPESWNFYETLGMWWGYGPPNRGDQWWGRMRGQNR